MKQEELLFTSDLHFFHHNCIKWMRTQFLNVEELAFYLYSTHKDASKEDRDKWMKCKLSDETIDKHNSYIVDEWNKKATKQSVIMCLGDFSLGKEEETIKLMQRLKGQIHLIRGNHDSVIDKPSVRKLFADIKDVKEIKIERVGGEGWTKYQWISLSHYCHTTWNKQHHGSWHLYGHSHGRLADQPTLSMDIGVDTNALKPYTYEEIEQFIIKKKDIINGT